MTLAFWCIPLAAFLPLVWIGYAKVKSGNYDNANPRVWRAALQGEFQRAAFAETNGYEAFPPFAAAVIVAHVAGAQQPVIDGLAGLFIAARVLHGMFYIKGNDLFRSLAWLVGFMSIIGLFLTAGWAA
jgi:uncharacterized MAPEG superfamily protein